MKERPARSLAAVRKAAEHLSLSPGGGFHVVDTFASSKMRAAQLDVCEKACAAHGKTQLSSRPCSKTLPHFEALYLPSASLRHRVVNKLLGRDARETFAACRAAPPKPKKRRYRKLHIRSHFTATNMTGTAPHII